MPICVSYKAGEAVTKECFLLDKRSAEFKLAKANSCPSYLSANDRASGYYITAYKPEMLRTLLRSGTGSLDSGER